MNAAQLPRKSDAYPHLHLVACRCLSVFPDTDGAVEHTGSTTIGSGQAVVRGAKLHVPLQAA